MCLQRSSPRDTSLSELASLDPTSLDADGLMQEIVDLSIFVSQAQAQLARLAGALDAWGGAAEAGHRSTAAFARNACGTTAGGANELVTVARGLRRLPATESALQAGQISFDKAQIIVRAAVAEGRQLCAAEPGPGAGEASGEGA